MKALSELLLSTNGLTKQYGHHKAVDKVNLHIKKGAIYGFIGRNGAGKTTCLNLQEYDLRRGISHCYIFVYLPQA